MRITQNGCFLMSLLSDASTGKMLPAAMQRPYVWLKEDVEALCDSILSNFPIGSFVLWEPGKKADLSAVAKNRLGPVLTRDHDGRDYSPVQLLLDGQNRLATLAWMMVTDFDKVSVSAHEAESATWLSDERLVLDFDSKSMKFVPAAEASVGLRLPAWTLASSSINGGNSPMMFIRECWNKWMALGISEEEADQFINFHDKCARAFSDARTTVTVIEDATAEEARSAFLRICRVGVQMTQDDFEKAVNWSPAT